MTSKGFARDVLKQFGIKAPASTISQLRSTSRFDGIDLDAEYELIKQKKSKLSANMREAIVHIIEAKRKENK